MTKVSIVVPLLNEETLLSELVGRIKENVEKKYRDFELILIDDGSVDRTWELIGLESMKDSRVKGIQFSRNFGHHYAITAGLNYSRGDWVIVMDGDLQDRPEVIPELISKAQEGFEVVFVSRKNRPESRKYLFVQKLFYGLVKWSSGIKIDSTQANFSIVSRKVVNAFKTISENARFYNTNIKWLGFKSCTIFADHGKRYSGHSSYTLKRRIRLAFDIILSYSEKPLRMAIGLGILISLISTVTAFLILYRYIVWGFTVSGWASTIITILFSTGSILVVLGIMGVYLGRVFQEVKKRPLYIVSNSFNLDENY